MDPFTRWMNIGLGLWMIGTGGFVGALVVLGINTWKPFSKSELARKVLGHDDGIGLLIMLWVFGNLGAIIATYLLRDMFAGTDAAIVRVVVGVVFLVLNGIVLFAMKSGYLWHYAVLELTFAVVVGGVALYRLKQPLVAVDALSLMTSLYLLVRGLDNLNKGYEEKMAAWAKARLEKASAPESTNSKP